MARTPRSLLLVLGLVAATACGARVTDDQRAAAAAGGAAPVVTGAAATASDAEVAPVEPGSVSAGAAPVTTIGPNEGTPQDPAGTPADNGGATDVGVTADTIRIGNVSTLSGPVPGLFQGAVVGTQAALAMQNARGGVHGRRLRLDVRDDQLDSAQNRAMTTDLLDDVFAFAGSLGVYDDAGAEAVGKSGIPAVVPALSGARRQLPNNFNIAPAEVGGTQLAPFRYYKDKFGDAVQAVGTLFGDVPISRASQEANEAAGRSLGWKFLYSRGYSPTETEFTADVVRMRQLGVKLVFLAGSEPKTLARIANAMRQQGFDVPIATMNIGYDQSLLTLAPEALEGMHTTMQWSMFAGEDAASVPEVKVMNQWVQRVQPGFEPDLYALLGWASARYLIQAIDRVGPKLTRTAVNEAMRIAGPFDANGLLAPGDPGRKRPPTCIVVTVLRDRHFQRVDPPSGYRCDLGGYFRSRP